VIVLETERLTVRRITEDDAIFILRLLNEPSFLRHIGDRGVRTVADAVKSIVDGPIASYDRFGFGMFLVELKDGLEPLGICGLLKRDALDDVDLGFAFVPEFWSRGYAFESASAMVAWGRETRGLRRIVAIVSQENLASINLLMKLGFSFERMVLMPGGKEELRLFTRNLGDQDHG